MAGTLRVSALKKFLVSSFTTSPPWFDSMFVHPIKAITKMIQYRIILFVCLFVHLFHFLWFLVD